MWANRQSTAQRPADDWLCRPRGNPPGPRPLLERELRPDLSTLAELQRNGLIEAQQGTRPGSSTYTLTAAGRRQLADLLRQPQQPSPPRNPLMLRLFFGHTLGADACRVLLRQAKGEAERRLGQFQAIRAELATDPHTKHHPYWLLTISAGEHTARAAIAWADESLAALGQLQ